MCDTKLDEKEGFKLVETKVKEAMLTCPEGYDGFLYVGRYGNRFTDEDMKVFEFLTKIFGPHFAKQMFILVLTAGDNFENDHADDGLTFEDWCRNQKGYFRNVMKECGNRIMLFNNATKDEAEKTKQFDKLLSFVKAIDKKYTDKNFERAKSLKDDEKYKQEQILTEVSLLLDKLQETKGEFSQDKLLELSGECSRVLSFIQRQDQHASFSRQITEKLERLKESVDRGHINNQENINENQESAINQIREIEKEIENSIHELHLSYKETKQNYRVNIFHLVGFALVCVFTGVAFATAVGGAVALAGAGGVAAVAGSAGGTAGVAAGVDAAVAAGSAVAAQAAVIAGSVGGAVGSATSAFAGRFLHQNINNQ